MLEQISSLVKEYGQQTVVDNPAIPDSQNNEVLAEATHTITRGLQNILAGGGLQDILALFTGGSSKQQGTQSGGIGGLLNNPAVSMIIGNLVNNLMSKFNMSHSQATNVSNNLVPDVLSGLVTRTASNDPENDAFDLNDLIGSLTGGNVATKESAHGGFDFQGLLNKITSGNSGAEGFNLDNIVSQVTQGAKEQQQEQKQSGGGISDMIKGLFN